MVKACLLKQENAGSWQRISCWLLHKYNVILSSFYFFEYLIAQLALNNPKYI